MFNIVGAKTEVILWLLYSVLFHPRGVGRRLEPASSRRSRRPKARTCLCRLLPRTQAAQLCLHHRATLLLCEPAAGPTLLRSEELGLPRFHWCRFPTAPGKEVPGRTAEAREATCVGVVPDKMNPSSQDFTEHSEREPGADCQLAACVTVSLPLGEMSPVGQRSCS